MNRVMLKIYGRVQGVFYRAKAREKAQDLGLEIEAENEPDGTVRIVAWGRPARHAPATTSKMLAGAGGGEALKKFIKWCKKGPPSAKVEKIDIKWL